MYKILVFLLTILSLVGCRKEVIVYVDPPLDPDHVLPLEICDFMVMDAEGNDLLDPDTPGGLDISGIYTMYMNQEGHITNIYPNRPYPPLIRRGGWMSETASDTYGGLYFLFRIETFGIEDLEENMEDGTTAVSTNYIHWDDENTDILECKYIGRGYSHQLTEITVNGTTCLQVKGHSLPAFKIVIDGDQRVIEPIFRPGFTPSE